MLTQLLQAEDDWAYSLYNGIGALPMCQELAVGAEEEQEHTVSGLEFLMLSRVVIKLVLLGLGCLQMLPHNQCDFVD